MWLESDREGFSIMERFATKTALSRGVIRVLSYIAAYICIVVLMDMGNQYAGVASFSGRSEQTWLVSCVLLAVFSIITVACHAERPSARGPVANSAATLIKSDTFAESAGN